MFILSIYGLPVAEATSVTIENIWGWTGSTGIYDNFPYALAVYDNYVYVTLAGGDGAGTDRVLKFDVSDPYAAVLVGQSTNNGLDLPTSIAIDETGNYAFVTNFSADSVAAFDISGDIPVLISTVADWTLWGAQGITIRDNRAYVVAYQGSRFTIVNVENKENMIILGSVSSGYLNEAVDVFVLENENLAFVSCANGGGEHECKFTSINFDNENNPTIQSTMADERLYWLEGFAVDESQKLAYIVTYTDDFAVVDIENENNMVVLGCILNDAVNLDGCSRIVKRDNLVFVTVADDNGIAVIDVSDSATPYVVFFQSFSSLDSPLGIGISDNGQFLYVASSYNNSFVIFDISWAPNKPTNLLPSARQTTTDVTISCVVTDNDGDDMNVFLYDNSDNTLAMDWVWIESGGTAEFAWESLTRGNTYTFFVRGQDNTGLWGENSDTQSFLINSLPTTPTTLTLTAPNKAGETLTASSSGSTDAEDAVTYYYFFYNENSTTTIQDWSITATYTLQATDINDNIRVFALANDGYENSDNLENSLIILDTAPTAPTTLTLNSPKIAESLSASASGSTDGEGDSITYYYKFFNQTDSAVRQDYSTTSTYTIAANDVHDTFKIYAKAYDGYYYSSELENGTTVANTAPVMTANAVTPSTPYDDDTLTCTPSATDADSDSVTYGYQWYEDSVLMSGKTSSTLAASYTIVGHLYKCQVTPYDGYEIGSATYSNEVTVQSLPSYPPPTVENLKTENQTNPTTMLYTANPTFSWDFTGSPIDLLFENTTETVNSGIEAYTKVNKWTIDYNSENLRIDFDMHVSVGTTTMHGKIYKNGVAIGTGRSTNSTSYVTFTENIGGWQISDNVQLYIYQDSGGLIYTNNFKIYGHIQGSYEIWVGTTSGTSNKWNSGQIADNSLSAVYVGSALATNTTYYVQVRAKDNWNWSDWATGTFKMTTGYYTVRLRWEENMENAHENATLTAYMTSHGTQENDIENGTLENLVYPERPYLLRLAYSTYYRDFIPATDDGTIYFYITDDGDLTEYVLRLVDTTGMFGPTNGGTVTVSKSYGENTFIVHKAAWPTNFMVSVYLVKGDVYRIAVSSNYGTRDMGDYTFSLVSPVDINIYPILIEGSPVWITDYIVFSAERGTENTIEMFYQDNTENTVSTSFYIYEFATGVLLHTATSDNESLFEAIWAAAEDNASYEVRLSATHTIFGDIERSVIVGTNLPEPSLPAAGTPPFRLPLALGTLGGLVLMFVISMSFSATHAFLSALATIMAAGLFVYMGWFPPAVSGVLAFLAVGVVIWKLTSGR